MLTGHKEQECLGCVGVGENFIEKGPCIVQLNLDKCERI